jgi:hypothetical protein
MKAQATKVPRPRWEDRGRGFCRGKAGEVSVIDWRCAPLVG